MYNKCALQLTFYRGGYHRTRDLSTIFFSYLSQFFLHKFIKYPVFLPDVMSHNSLKLKKFKLGYMHNRKSFTTKGLQHGELQLYTLKLLFVKMVTLTYLPVWIMFFITTRHRTDVRFFCWQVCSYSILEMISCKMILKMSVRIFCCCLELADWTNLYSILP